MNHWIHSLFAKLSPKLKRKCFGSHFRASLQLICLGPRLRKPFMIISKKTNDVKFVVVVVVYSSFQKRTVNIEIGTKEVAMPK
jgi:hypothetical protein